MRKMKTKIFLLMIMGLFIFTAKDVFADKDILTYAFSTHVGPLHPHDYGANLMFAQNLIYEPLVAYGENGKILPCLALKWSISPDNKTYTFNLRQDVLFSDGSEFDANVVVKNFDAIFANKKRHDWMKLIEHIESYKALDKKTFSITLNKPYAATLQELSFVRPIRFASLKTVQALQTKDFTPIGTGPWVWQKREKGQYDLFVRNEKYWNKKAFAANAPKKFKIMVIADAEARAVALETDLIDLIATVMGDHGTAEIQPDAYALFAKDDKYITQKSNPRNTRIIAMNSGRGALQDIKVRKAIMRAINREAILSGVLLNQELPAQSLMAKDLPYCDVNLTPYPYSLTEARKLLDEAGWMQAEGERFRKKDGQTLRISLKFVAHESLMRSIAQVVQSNLAEIGIELALVGEEGLAFLESQRIGNFDLVFANSSGAPYAPFSYLGIMQVPGHPEYQAQKHIAQKAELDEAMDLALSANQENEIKKHFASVWRIIHEAEIYVPLSFTVDKALYKKSSLKGFTFAPISYELDLSQVEKLQK